MFFIGSILYWIFLVLTVILMFFPALIIWLITLPFDKNRRVLHQFTCFWGSLYTWMNPFFKVSIKGKEKLKGRQSYVYCSNHQSVIDIIVLFRLFKHFKWVSKKEIFKVPFMGWNMYLNNYLYLDRSSPKSQIKMMKEGEALLKQGSSLIMFPEGTRSKTGKLGRFRDGAFLLAQKTKSPIVPIAVTGTGEAFRDGSLIFKKVYHFHVEILDPILPEEESSPKALGRLCQNKIAKSLGQEELE